MTHTEYMREWRAKNLERSRAIVRKAEAKWRRNNPSALKARNEKARSNAHFGGNRAAVLERDGHICRVCGGNGGGLYLTVDHINRDRSDNRIENLQTLCPWCHGAKDGPARQIKSGWHFSRRGQ